MTHWGQVKHICVSKLTIIGSDNGSSPGRRQAIVWINDGILLIRSLRTNFSKSLCEIRTFSFKKNPFENVVCEMAAILPRTQCDRQCPARKNHNDIIKWKHFPRYWPFVRGIHRLPVNSSHKGQWRRALMFSLIYAWTNGWINTRDAGDLRRHGTHYDATVTCLAINILDAVVRFK